ncbi:unnamed protein product, partial [Onchocerca flexuosa]|uniref:Homeobox domain-containing protein n=1 Tax=Onchocerca flexuosa TaxID=387005 RepID=A0A183H9Q6_9BILA
VKIWYVSVDESFLGIPSISFISIFLQEYLTDQYMPRSRRLLIARSLGLNESQVKTWFQNRRAKDKRNDKNAILLRHTNSNTSSPPGSSPEVNENSAALIQQLCSQTLNPIQLTL